ncbi:MAG: hypothetical protein HY231_01980 [Acidobacteria bacterium]|nr:hypothetical protein [Acidobacteriota bacterium]
MIVVDANLLVTLVSGDPRGNLVLQHFLDWLDRDIELHAPALAVYEITNALTRMIAAGAFPNRKTGASISRYVYHTNPFS